VVLPPSPKESIVTTSKENLAESEQNFIIQLKLIVGIKQVKEILLLDHFKNICKEHQIYDQALEQAKAEWRAVFVFYPKKLWIYIILYLNMSLTGILIWTNSIKPRIKSSSRYRKGSVSK